MKQRPPRKDVRTLRVSDELYELIALYAEEHNITMKAASDRLISNALDLRERTS